MQGIRCRAVRKECVLHTSYLCHALDAWVPALPLGGQMYITDPSPTEPGSMWAAMSRQGKAHDSESASPSLAPALLQSFLAAVGLHTVFLASSMCRGAWSSPSSLRFSSSSVLRQKYTPELSPVCQYIVCCLYLFRKVRIVVLPQISALPFAMCISVQVT